MRSEFVGVYVAFSLDRNIVFGITAFKLNFCYFQIYFFELACTDILQRKNASNTRVEPQKFEKPTQNNCPVQRQKLGIIRDLIRDFVAVSQKLPVNRQKLGIMPRGPPTGTRQPFKQKRRRTAICRKQARRQGIRTSASSAETMRWAIWSFLRRCRSLRSVRVIARPPPPVQLVHQLCVGVVPDAFLLLLGLNGYKD